MLNTPIAALAPTPTMPAPPPTHGVTAEAGAFARELDRAQDSRVRQEDAAHDGETAAAPAPAAPDGSREARAKPRSETERGKSEASVARRAATHADQGPARTGEGVPAADAARTEAAAEAAPDLPALLASLMHHPAAAPAAVRGEAASAKDTARAVAGADAAPVAADGRDAAPLAAAPTAATDHRPASTELPTFAMPQATAATNATTPAPAEAVAAAPAPYAAQIDAPVGSPDFAPGLSAQVSVMVRDGIQEARLQLNPAEMGPITVQIQVEGNTAQVTMTAEQAPTRDALQQAMPTLAGALREEGLTLTGGGVFEQAGQPRDDGQGSPGRGPGGGSGSGGRRDDGGPAEAPARRIVSRGNVDLYA